MVFLSLALFYVGCSAAYQHGKKMFVPRFFFDSICSTLMRILEYPVILWLELTALNPATSGSNAHVPGVPILPMSAPFFVSILLICDPFVCLPQIKQKNTWQQGGLIFYQDSIGPPAKS